MNRLPIFNFFIFLNSPVIISSSLVGGAEVPSHAHSVEEYAPDFLWKVGEDAPNYSLKEGQDAPTYPWKEGEEDNMTASSNIGRVGEYDNAYSGTNGQYATTNYIDVQSPYEIAAKKMENQFLYLLSVLPDKIDDAIYSITFDLVKGKIRTQSYGWALVAGGFMDTIANFINNNRVPTDFLTSPDFAAVWGYNFGYGYGFGAPYLLPAFHSDTNLECSSTDFLNVVNKSGLQERLTTNLSEAKVYNVGLDLKQSVHCLLQHAGDYAEAAEVSFLIDDLVDAGTAFLRIKDDQLTQ